MWVVMCRNEDMWILVVDGQICGGYVSRSDIVADLKVIFTL